MRTIIYTCPYVPAEWIVTHGLRTERLLLERTDSTFSAARTEGVCPFVRSFINAAVIHKEAAGIVVTTLCDQMRRVFDVLVRQCDVPAFLMNVPSTWQSLAAQKLYLDELKRLSLFLVRLGGKVPSDEILAETMLRYDEARKTVLAARPYLSARRHAEMIAAFGRNGRTEGRWTTSSLVPRLSSLVPLAIVGGPLMREDFELFDMIEQAGGRIVLDATETGERGMCAPFDRRRLSEDPLMELAKAYFGGIPDTSRRPNDKLYTWLKGELSGRGVRGIIFRRYVWCDIWHAELQRLKDWTNLPVLDIDAAGDNDTDRQRTTNRIRAFLEMLL